MVARLYYKTKLEVAQYYDRLWRKSLDAMRDGRIHMEAVSGDPYGAALDRKILREKFRDDMPAMVLDTGCGSGSSTRGLAEDGSTVVLMDLALGALLLSRALYRRLGLNDRTHYVRADLEKLPFRNLQFDLVFSQGIPYARQFMPRNVTKKKGWVVFSNVPNLFSAPTLYGKIPSVLIRLLGGKVLTTDFTYNTIRRTVESCGLQVQQVLPVRPDLAFGHAIFARKFAVRLSAFFEKLAEKFPWLSLGYAYFFVFARK